VLEEAAHHSDLGHGGGLVVALVMIGLPCYFHCSHCPFVVVVAAVGVVVGFAVAVDFAAVVEAR